MMFDVRYRFYERLAYIRWCQEFGAELNRIGWTYYADQVRGKI
jgi:hypothetical protein